LRADEGRLRDVPVILLTALTDPAEVLKGVECGANAFVGKPYDDGSLLARMDSAWANHVLRAAPAGDCGLTVFFDSREHAVDSDPRRVLELLLSTHNHAVRQNADLVIARDELRDLNEKLEERVEERTAELRAEVARREAGDARLNTILESNSDGILVLDAGGVVQSANRAAHAILGRSAGNLIGTPFDVAVVAGEGSEIDVVREDGAVAVVEMHAVGAQLEDDDCHIVSLRDITEHKRQQERLRELSMLDELTGLYNRRGLAQRVEQQMELCARRDSEFVLVYLDLDELKDVNDLYGHQEGDRALTAVAQIMTTCSRASDILARVGGDEFVIVAIDAKGDDTDTVVGRLQNEIQRWNVVSGSPYRLSVSVGTAIYDPAQPCVAADLLSRADESMYREKLLRKGSMRVCPKDEMRSPPAEDTRENTS